MVTSEGVIDSLLLCQTSLQRDPSAGKPRTVMMGTHPVSQTQASGGSDRPRTACRPYDPCARGCCLSLRGREVSQARAILPPRDGLCWKQLLSTLSGEVEVRTDPQVAAAGGAARGSRLKEIRWRPREDRAPALGSSTGSKV